MKHIPYSRQLVTDADVSAVVDVLRGDWLTQGPMIPAFEQAFAAKHEVANAIAVANATAGLHIACLALGAGPGKRVWTSPNSFLASANCALYCGAAVDFVDIDPATRNMSVDELAARLEQAAATGTLPDIVIPVDFSGLPCDLREMRALADRFGFKLLQDASHATGASYLGRPVGSRFADATVFSFHAVKIVTCGEGGMVTTQDSALAARLRLLRSHGMTRDVADLQYDSDGPWYYEQHDLGYNYRITDIQAALGLSQLARLEEMHAARIALANHYDSLLEGLPVRLPTRPADRTSAWHLYVVEIDSTRTAVTRRALFAALRAANIGVNVHYIPIHTQPYYRRLGFANGMFPASEKYYHGAISLPLFPALARNEQMRVVDVIRSVLE